MNVMTCSPGRRDIFSTGVVWNSSVGVVLHILYRAGFLRYVIILASLVSMPSGAANFYERHGNNFTCPGDISGSGFDSPAYMPVIWDIRAGAVRLRDYYISYGMDTPTDPDSTLNAIDLLMKEAWDHGINFANARGEILRMTPGELAHPDSSDFFVNIAEIIRLDSLNLIAGGFRTSISDSVHNDAVIDYLAEYKDYGSPRPDGSGGFVGVFGFDEPDAMYEGPGWNRCGHDTAWHDLVRKYAMKSRDSLSLPFGTFLCRFKTRNGDSLWYRNTIPLFCEELDYPVFDKYPCLYGDPVGRSYPDRVEFDGIIGSTDLIPSDSVDYYAYADRDEIFAVDDSGWLRIYGFDNVTSRADTIGISRVDSFQLPPSLRVDPVWAASDFRASDTGDRSTGEHHLNGAILFFGPTDPNDNIIVFHDGSDLLFLENAVEIRGAAATSAVCAGEYNYPVHHPTMPSRRGSVISRGDLRILVCHRSVEAGGIVDRARIFAWNRSTETFDDVTGGSSGIELAVRPVKAVWGVFRPTRDWWNPFRSDDESAFIVIDGDGNYQIIYEYTPPGSEIPEWTVSGEFTNLFAWDETSFIARKTRGFPPYVAGMDYICHLTGCGAENEAVLEFASGPGGNAGDPLSVYESSKINLPSPFVFSDINDASSCRPYKFFDDALVISFKNGTGGSMIYRSVSRIDFQGGCDIEIPLERDTLLASGSDESPLLASARIYGVRQPYRAPIIADPDPPRAPFQISLPEADIPAESKWNHFADQHEALDTMFVYGIDGTSRNNCLIHNLRCGGRRQDGQLTFHPSPDTLLYLATTALVHGCRGIHLRAMDITMMCGNGGGSAPPGVYRCPSLLMNWGPGPESTNPDMLGRMFDVIRSLTGRNTPGPDFLSALIDENWSILDTASVRNAVYERGRLRYADNELLNFIALENSVSGDILLMAVNDSDDMLRNTYIRFSNRPGDGCAVNRIAGFETVGDAPPGETVLVLNYDSMPAFTAGLYVIGPGPPRPETGRVSRHPSRPRSGR